jgi:hypothetical protein
MYLNEIFLYNKDFIIIWPNNYEIFLYNNINHLTTI